MHIKRDTHLATKIVKFFLGERRRNQNLHQLATGLAVALTFGVCAAKANATTYYVSPAGSNGAGTSWATAWNEMNKIQWTKIKANDTIQLDKGVYMTTLTVPSTVPSGVTIYQSTAAGHTGLVEIDGSANSLALGIDIQGPIVGIYGAGKFIDSSKHELTFLVQNCKTAGVRVYADKFPKPNSSAVVQCLSARFNPVGVLCPSTTVPVTAIVSNCLLHDNPTAQVQCGSGITAQVQYSWLFNLGSPAPSGQTAAGVIMQTGSVSQCVLGPFLNYGVFGTKPASGGSNPGSYVTVGYSLLLDAFQQNLHLTNPITTNILYNTSFSTPKNYYLLPHSNLVSTSTTPGLSVGACVEYGAGISIPASVGSVYPDPTKYPNYEYKVTGNTTALAPAQIDPKFVDQSVYTLPNTVSESTLEQTSFQITSTSPQVGPPFYSVPTFLSSYFPGN